MASAPPTTISSASSLVNVEPQPVYSRGRKSLREGFPAAQKPHHSTSVNSCLTRSKSPLKSILFTKRQCYRDYSPDSYYTDSYYNTRVYPGNKVRVHFEDGISAPPRSSKFNCVQQTSANILIVTTDASSRTQVICAGNANILTARSRHFAAISRSKNVSKFKKAQVQLKSSRTLKCVGWACPEQHSVLLPIIKLVRLEFSNLTPVKTERIRGTLKHNLTMSAMRKMEKLGMWSLTVRDRLLPYVVDNPIPSGNIRYAFAAFAIGLECCEPDLMKRAVEVIFRARAPRSERTGPLHEEWGDAMDTEEEDVPSPYHSTASDPALDAVKHYAKVFLLPRPARVLVECYESCRRRARRFYQRAAAGARKHVDDECCTLVPNRCCKCRSQGMLHPSGSGIRHIWSPYVPILVHDKHNDQNPPLASATLSPEDIGRRFKGEVDGGCLREALEGLTDDKNTYVLERIGEMVDGLCKIEQRRFKPVKSKSRYY